MVAETPTANGSSDGNLAATYALIYSFLSIRSHEKAAAAVKKAAKDIVVLKDNVAAEGASLDEIVRWWKAKEEADAKNQSSSDSNSDSSSDSGSNASSSNGSSDSEFTSSSPSSSSNSESSSDSSDPDNSWVAQNGLDSKKAAKIVNANGQAVASGTVISDHHKTCSGTLQEKGPKKLSDSIPRNSKKTTKSSSSSSSSSSDSDSSSSESVATPVKASQVATHLPKAAAAVVSAMSDSTAARTAKKRRISEDGNAVATVIATETSSPAPNQNGKGNGKRSRKSNAPFQRIKADAVEFHDERLKDNAFVARGGSANDYGARANQDLIVTRGDGFRKEKNKKKRGSYRGGEITMQSHSIKFT